MSRRQTHHVQTVQPKPHRSARDRIVDAADTLFFKHGTRAVSIAQIAYLADTNSDAVLGYFGSKDGLVAHYLEQYAKRNDLPWAEMERDHPGDPGEQLRAWIGIYANAATEKFAEGCELTRISFELASLRYRYHPARVLIKKHKLAERDEVARRCAEAGYSEPKALADKLFMLAQGAEIAAMTIGDDGPGIHFVKAAEALLASHAKKESARTNTSEVNHA